MITEPKAGAAGDKPVAGPASMVLMLHWCNWNARIAVFKDLQSKGSLLLSAKPQKFLNPRVGVLTHSSLKAVTNLFIFPNS